MLSQLSGDGGIGHQPGSCHDSSPSSSSVRTARSSVSRPSRSVDSSSSETALSIVPSTVVNNRKAKLSASTRLNCPASMPSDTISASRSWTRVSRRASFSRYASLWRACAWSSRLTAVYRRRSESSVAGRSAASERASLVEGSPSDSVSVSVRRSSRYSMKLPNSSCLVS